MLNFLFLQYFYFFGLFKLIVEAVRDSTGDKASIKDTFLSISEQQAR